jgi:hypothetical protein
MDGGRLDLHHQRRRRPAAPARPGPGTLLCTIPRLPLVAGRYLLTAAIGDPATLQPIARFRTWA